MGYYQTDICPTCKSAISTTRRGLWSRPVIGRPLIVCLKCSQIIETSQKEWQDLSYIDVAKWLLKTSWILIGTCLILGGLGIIFAPEEYRNQAIAIGVLLGALLTLFGEFIFIRESINRTKESSAKFREKFKD